MHLICAPLQWHCAPSRWCAPHFGNLRPKTLILSKPGMQSNKSSHTNQFVYLSEPWNRKSVFYLKEKVPSFTIAAARWLSGRSSLFKVSTRSPRYWASAPSEFKDEWHLETHRVPVSPATSSTTDEPWASQRETSQLWITGIIVSHEMTATSGARPASTCNRTHVKNTK